MGANISIYRYIESPTSFKKRSLSPILFPHVYFCKKIPPNISQKKVVRSVDVLWHLDIISLHTLSFLLRARETTKLVGEEVRSSALFAAVPLVTPGFATTATVQNESLLSLSLRCPSLPPLVLRCMTLAKKKPKQQI